MASAPSIALTKLLQRQGKSHLRDLGAIDLHTHVYLPRYMEVLRARRDVPFVRKLPAHSGDAAPLEDRLVILPAEQKQLEDAALGKHALISAGRPIGAEYFDVREKLAYMDRHGIATSVLSLANPWLDFLPLSEQAAMAALLNDDMEAICAAAPLNRLFAFGVTPQQPDEAIAELHHIAALAHVRGIILGTCGFGNGLDDPAMLPFYETAEALGLTIFLHPHYGVGNEHYHAYGHALFLALGFTFETTVAVSQLVLSGALDRVPRLRLLLAHAGGTLPFLAGRLDSCVAHDLAIATRLQHAPSAYLKRFYYDAVAYHTPALQCLLDFVGADHVVFGTDHPFFPPSGAGSSESSGDSPSSSASASAEALGDTLWRSTIANYETLADLDVHVQDAILRDTAEKLLGL